MGVGLEATLAECKKAAESGYAIAKLNSTSLKTALDRFNTQLSVVKQNSKDDKAKVPEYLSQYVDECDNVIGTLKRLHLDVTHDLEDKKSNLALFNIVVYGRTMAGKSTLMETLTYGKGESIGKGSQRTTLDVRGYKWNGLTIFDTPGIAAAATDGREDEVKAYHVAKYADMMVFLFSDDAPQQSEAMAFAKLKKMGKPILVLINVKSQISGNKVDKMVLYDMRKKMNDKVLDDMRDNFLRMAGNGQETWKDNVKFVYVHLHAAFLSRLKNTESLQENAQILNGLSRIEQVEKVLVDEIKSKGSFLQYKTFIDSIYEEVWETVKKLRQQERSCSTVLDSFTKGNTKLAAERTRFVNYAQGRINDFVNLCNSEMKNMAVSFAQANYDNEDAGEDWGHAIRQMGIDEAAQNMIEGLASECEERLQAFCKEFQDQLRFKQRVQAQGIDGVKIIDIGSNIRIATGVVGLAAALLGMSNPVGWLVLGAIGIFSYIFGNREEKIRKAINKMRYKLEENVDEIVISLRNGLNKSLNDGILRDYLDKVEIQFQNMERNIRDLQQTQRNSTLELNHNLLAMNKQLLEAACDHLKLATLKAVAGNMARIPGSSVLIEVTDGTELQDIELVKGLGDLLQEEIHLVHKKNAIADLAVEFLQVDKNCISVDTTAKEVKITNPGNEAYRRVTRYQNLVEQLTDYTITLTGKVPQYKPETVDQPYGQGIQAQLPKKRELPWYSSETDLDDRDVQWDVALHYINGDGVEKNLLEGYKWAEKAARNGHGRAASYLGDCHRYGIEIEQDYQGAFAWYEKAVELGYYRAEKFLGDCYYFGKGCSIDQVKAAEMYEKAAKHGVPEGMFCLGNVYHFAIGRPRNDKEAVKWFREAAKFGIGFAQNNLGCCYYDGLGIKQNYEQARLLYIKGRDNGSPMARRNLSVLFKER